MSYDSYMGHSSDSRIIGVRLQLLGCWSAIDRNRRHIADGQDADVNVGYGANILDSPMSAVSLYAQVVTMHRWLRVHGVGPNGGEASGPTKSVHSYSA